MEPKVTSKSIHHLGIVSAMIEELGIVEIIDSIIPSDSRKKLTVGEAVKAMVINGLGFTGRAMYLATDFFRNKPVDLLIKKGIRADDINDDVLGRSLDKIHEVHPQLLFSRIAYRAAKHLNINTRIVHLDTSSKIMFGDYDSEDEETDIVNYGYSKNKRHDLKQIMLSLLSSNDGNLPLVGGIIAGNTSDATHFRDSVKALKENVLLQENADMLLVADAQFYNEETIQEAQFLKWLTRVPETSSEAKNAIVWALKQQMTKISEKYSYIEKTSKYGKVDQRWLIVRSVEAFDAAKHAVAKAVEKEKIAFEKELKKLNSKGFSCNTDASKALKKVTKKLKYHSLGEHGLDEEIRHLKRGKPTPGDPTESTYYITVSLNEDSAKINIAIEKKSLFILATNDLDEKRLPVSAMLQTYKDQNKTVERGFRFLKNPICLAKSIFLKKQSRIEALGVVMMISLLVYSAIEYSLRKALEQKNETIPDQLKKPTKTPTGRRVFEMFEDVLVVTVRLGDKFHHYINNLTDVLIKILNLLGETYMQKYLII